MEKYFSLGIYNYDREKICDLYDSNVELIGQAYNIIYSVDRSGYHSLEFEIPRTIDDVSSLSGGAGADALFGTAVFGYSKFGQADITSLDRGKNFRWNYLKSDYLIRYTCDDEEVWFVASKPSKAKAGKSIVGHVSCSGIESLLKTGNIYATFDDENGIGTIGDLMDLILKGTPWMYDPDYSDTLYESDGRTEKVRSLISNDKKGALDLIATVCGLFCARPVFDTAHMRVSIMDMQNHGLVLEGEVGRNLNALTVNHDSSNMCTRVYIEGEYGDYGYVGIDDVKVNSQGEIDDEGEPWGLPFLVDFDYYRELGVFSWEHENALTNYLNDIRQVKTEIREKGVELTECEDELNTLVGQCKFALFYKSKGYDQPAFTYGFPAGSTTTLEAGDMVVILKSNHTHTYEEWTGNPITQMQNAYGVAKFITKAAGKIGAAEVQIEAKQKTIAQLEYKISSTTRQEKIDEYNAEIDKLNVEIEVVYNGDDDSEGLYSMMYRVMNSAGLLFELDTIFDALHGLNASQEQIESIFADAMGPMLRDGYWSNQNYIPGQEKCLYADARLMTKEMCRPKTEYTFDYVRVTEDFDIPIEDIEINGTFHIYDEELQVDDDLYIKRVSYGVDNKSLGTIEVGTQDVILTGGSFGDLLGKISNLANILDQKNAVYDRAKAINKDGLVDTSLLYGDFDTSKFNFYNSIGDWSIDPSGNFVFNSGGGGGSVRIGGGGVSVATDKDADGNWDYHPTVTPDGIDADDVNHGFLDPDRLDPTTGSRIDISDNSTINTINSNICAVSSAICVIDSNVGIISSNVGIINTNIAAVNSNINVLNSNINTVNSNINIVNSSINTINSNINTVNSNINTVNSNINTVNSNINTINSNINTVNSNINTVNSNINIVNSNINTINSNINTVNSNINTVNSNINTINSSINTINSSINTVNSVVNTVNSTVNTVNSLINTVNSVVNTVNSTINTVNSNINTINSNINTINSAITTINSNINTINSNICTINSNITTINSNICTINSNICTINSNITTINSNICTINSNIYTINSSITTINSNICAVNTDICALNVAVNAINTDISTQNFKFNAINANITTINTSIEAVNTDINTLNVAVSAINTSIETQDFKFEGINSNITAISTDICALNVAVNSINTSIETQDFKFEGINTNITAINTDISTLNLAVNSINTTISTQDFKFEGVNSSITAINTNIETINTNISTLNLAVNAINTDISTQNFKFDGINSSITAINADISAISSQVTAINTIVYADNASICVINTHISAIDETLIAHKAQIDEINANYITVADLEGESVRTGDLYCWDLNALNIHADDDIDCSTLTANEVHAANITLGSNSFDNVIVSASKSADGQTLTLTPLSGDPITFSKAASITSVTWGWAGGAAKATLNPTGQVFNSPALDDITPDTITWADNKKSLRITAKVYDENGTLVYTSPLSSAIYTTEAWDAGYAGAQLVGTWSGRTLTVTKSTSGSTSLTYSLTAGHSITYNSTSHKYTGTCNANAAGSTRSTLNYDSGDQAYQDGLAIGASNVKLVGTWSGRTLTVSRSDTGSESLTYSVTAGHSIVYNSTTHKYSGDCLAKVGATTRATLAFDSGDQAYQDGWGAAYSKVSIVADGTAGSTITFKYPASSIGVSASYTYNVAVDSSYAYIMGSDNVRARIENTPVSAAYSSGKTDGIAVGASQVGLTANVTTGVISKLDSGTTKEYAISLSIGSVNTNGSRTITPKAGTLPLTGVAQTISDYKDGWGAARSNVGLPTNGTGETMTFAYPSTSLGSSASKDYTLSIDNSYAYVKDGTATKARIANTPYTAAYSSGKADGISAGISQVGLTVNTTTGVISKLDSGTTKTYTVGLSTGTVNASGSRTVRATVTYDGGTLPVGTAQTLTDYKDAWGAARSKVQIVVAGTDGSTITFKYPGVTVGSQASAVYNVAVDNSYAYIMGGDSVKARVANTPYANAYSSGKTDGIAIGVSQVGLAVNVTTGVISKMDSGGTKEYAITLSTGTVNSSGLRTITPKAGTLPLTGVAQTISDYQDAWGAAYSKVSLTAAGTGGSTITFKYPSSSIGGQGSYTYNLAVDDSYAYIMGGTNVRARITNTAYTNGWSAARSEVKISYDGTSGSTVTFKYPTAAVGGQASSVHNVAVDNSYAYIMSGDNVRARIANTPYATAYSSGKTDGIAVGVSQVGLTVNVTTGIISKLDSGNTKEYAIALSMGTVNASGSRTITPKAGTLPLTGVAQTISDYKDGWGAAYSKVSLSADGTGGSTVTFKYPGSAVGAQASYTYNVAVDNSYAYIMGGNNVRARITNTAYAAGKSAVTVTAGITYNSTSHKYVATAYKDGTSASTKSSGTEAFDAGVSSVTVTAGIQYCTTTHKYTAKAYKGSAEASTITGGTEAYTAGVTAGKSAVAVTASITYNSTSHKYTATAYKDSASASTAASGTEGYDAGYTAGYTAGGTAAGVRISGTRIERVAGSNTKYYTISAGTPSYTYDNDQKGYLITATAYADRTALDTESTYTDDTAWQYGYAAGYYKGMEDYVDTTANWNSTVQYDSSNGYYIQRPNGNNTGSEVYAIDATKPYEDGKAVVGVSGNGTGVYYKSIKRGTVTVYLSNGYSTTIYIDFTEV